MTADGPAGSEILRQHAVGFRAQRLEAARLHRREAVQRPAEVHRRRSRIEQGGARLGKIFPGTERQSEAVSRGAADGGSAAHHHVPDRLRGLARRARLHDLDAGGKAPLIEQVQLAVLEPEGAEAHRSRSSMHSAPGVVEYGGMAWKPIEE